MAMQPIDLQTLFSQMDKVGRSQIQQREGLQIQATLQQVQSQKKAETAVRQVNETSPDPGNGTLKIKDENSGSPRDQGGKQKADKQEIQEPAADSNENSENENSKNDNLKNSFFRDPALGRNIDISG